MSLFNVFKRGKRQATTSSIPIKPKDASTFLKEEIHPKEKLQFQKEEAIERLNLRKETFALSLRKKSLENIVARVAVAMDDSGSMNHLYGNGTVQSVVERILPIALKFDDNGELDMWLFSDSYTRLPSITEKAFFGYVDKEVMKRASWGGTNYAPVIQDIVRKYANEETSKVPTFVIFITDGENFDRREAEKAITIASKFNIFFQFIGIGGGDFRFLKKLDEMDGRYIDNANFFEIKNINRITDEELYDMLLTEYPIWEQKARSVGLIL